MMKLVLILLFGLCVVCVLVVFVCVVEMVSMQGVLMWVVFYLDIDSKGIVIVLYQVRNLFMVDFMVQIVVVVVGESVCFLVKGSKIDGGYLFVLMVEDLQQSGVCFEVCYNIMMMLKISKN